MIELTKMQFIVDEDSMLFSIERNSMWFNPEVICYFEQEVHQDAEKEVDVTRLICSHGRLAEDVFVEEKPDTIIRKICLFRATKS